VLRPQLVLTLALAILSAACGGPTQTAPGTSATPRPSGVATSAPSGVAPSDVPSSEPTGSGSTSASPEPSGSTTPSAGTGTPGPSAAADACTGSQLNRNFFANAALALPWPVLCAVLPADWFVSAGKYNLAGGGTLTVSYKGPGGATIAMSEGAFCVDVGGCVPPGTDEGAAALGTRAGTFVALGDGGFAIVAGRGSPVSWLFVAQGLDQATVKALGAAVAEVAG
jgi:hypothetical protein